MVVQLGTLCFLSDKINKDNLDDSIGTEFLLEILINMRYVVSKSSAIYFQLKDAEAL